MEHLHLQMRPATSLKVKIGAEEFDQVFKLGGPTNHSVVTAFKCGQPQLEG